MQKHKYVAGLRRVAALALMAALLLTLCPLSAMAKESMEDAYTAEVQVFYASPAGYFATERVNVSPDNNVVAPNPVYVPAGYEAVNASPVTLIFDTAGRPIPGTIYFTYQQPQMAYQVKVNYATTVGVFATTYVNVSPANNVVSPDESILPTGYLPFSANPVTIAFDQNGKPIVDTVTFYYFIDAAQTGGSTGSTSSVAQNIIMNWNVPGQIVTLGRYEQDDSSSNGKEPIEWIVLRTDRGRALLISRYALDTRSFDEDWKNVSWADCDLRTWLNGTFFKNAFTSTQQQAIMHSNLSSNYVDTTVTTQDYIFLLSAAEAKKYMTNDLRLCEPTRYARGKSTATENGYCYWWLRDTTNRKNDANRVYPNGDVFEYGGNTNATGVRPAMWVNVEKAFGN